VRNGFAVSVKKQTPCRYKIIVFNLKYGTKTASAIFKRFFPHPSGEIRQKSIAVFRKNKKQNKNNVKYRRRRTFE